MTPRPTFDQYLLAQRNRSDSVGILAHDLSKDPDFPGGNAAQVRRYLLHTEAGDIAVAALDRACKEFAATMPRSEVAV